MQVKNNPPVRNDNQPVISKNQSPNSDNHVSSAELFNGPISGPRFDTVQVGNFVFEHVKATQQSFHKSGDFYFIDDNCRIILCPVGYSLELTDQIVTQNILDVSPTHLAPLSRDAVKISAFSSVVMGKTRYCLGQISLTTRDQTQWVILYSSNLVKFAVHLHTLLALMDGCKLAPPSYFSASQMRMIKQGLFSVTSTPKEVVHWTAVWPQSLFLKWTGLTSSLCVVSPNASRLHFICFLNPIEIKEPNIDRESVCQAFIKELYPDHPRHLHVYHENNHVTYRSFSFKWVGQTLHVAICQSSSLKRFVAMHAQLQV